MAPLKNLTTSVLKPYQDRIEKQIQDEIEQLGVKNHLRDACEYVLLSKGKRFRPALVLMIAERISKDANVLQAAMSVELFHAASLIADDLPCMDNDKERRGKPTVHTIYGESVALLATYALISAGYHSLVKNGQVLKNSTLPFAHQSDSLTVLAIENVSLLTGCLGTTGGQFLDLYPPNYTLPVIREVIYKKTVTLFEISFVLGWLFGGGETSCLDLVKKSANHFGMAFQLIDDFEDMAQDSLSKNSSNIANLLGKETVMKMFHGEIEQFHETIKELGLDQGPLLALMEELKNKTS